MNPHVHIGSETFLILFLSLPIALIGWRVIQLALKDTQAGPAISFIFH